MRFVAEKVHVDAGLASTAVGDAMHRGLIRCSQGTSAFAVARMMAAHRIHCVLVVSDDGACIGVVGDTELDHALCTGAISEFSARDIAVAPVLVEPSDTLDHAVQVMEEGATTHLVVVQPATNHAVGVLSMLDVADVLSEGGTR